MKQIKLTLIYLAIIPSVIAFDSVYTFGKNFYIDAQQSKAKVMELEKRIKALEPQHPAPLVMNTAPQFPVVTGQYVPLPSPLEVNRPSRAKNPPVDLTAASPVDKTDVPAAGQFTLAGESGTAQATAPKFVLATDK